MLVIALHLKSERDYISATQRLSCRRASLTRVLDLIYVNCMMVVSNPSSLCVLVKHTVCCITYENATGVEETPSLQQYNAVNRSCPRRQVGNIDIGMTVKERSLSNQMSTLYFRDDGDICMHAEQRTAQPEHVVKPLIFNILYCMEVTLTDIKIKT